MNTLLVVTIVVLAVETVLSLLLWAEARRGIRMLERLQGTVNRNAREIALIRKKSEQIEEELDNLVVMDMGDDRDTK